MRLIHGHAQAKQMVTLCQSFGYRKRVDLPKIFDRFHRADTARSREFGGVGLGLSIARWVAESHGVSIEAQSTRDGGAVFVVRLPVFQS